MHDSNSVVLKHKQLDASVLVPEARHFLRCLCAAETMKSSLWLAIEDAVSHGVSMPDMVRCRCMQAAYVCRWQHKCEDSILMWMGPVRT
eukprot:scaffold132175_cov17-Tisochrysis_lutea.AAC.1